MFLIIFLLSPIDFLASETVETPNIHGRQDYNKITHSTEFPILKSQHNFPILVL